jgi:AcrR family transcriptional regulator
MNIEKPHRNQHLESEDTRERVLAASQKLFAERGFEATSVRDITTEAGCNVASVNYHFGGKENLYIETFRTMLLVLRDQRMALLEDLMAREPLPTLEEFLQSFAEGFIEPLVDESRGRQFMALVSREMCENRLPHHIFISEFIQPLLARAELAMGKFGPKLEPMTARICVMSMIGQLLHALHAHHMFTFHNQPGTFPATLAEYIPYFVQFTAGGIRGCAQLAPTVGTEVST